MSKFKVGDKVIGTASANCYLVTNAGWIGTVEGYTGNGNLRVRGRKDYGGEGTFYVCDRDFELADSAPIAPKIEIPQKNKRKGVQEKKDHLHNKFSLAGITIKKVIYNKPATIVLWSDGSKTVVKCQPGKNGRMERYNKEKGLAMCIAKKALGNKGNFNNTLNAWLNK